MLGEYVKLPRDDTRAASRRRAVTTIAFNE
jgi:hypothetical protein